ncbi:LysR family transcriptional regulator [Oceanicoccus sp. KOV_DT_Chl]|uniref:LysR family transcriptional regulator n=1 Tax=Oceanicoccus sp. KOV_DT_Chl TaxID=1904639 RepID=UPI000C7966A3|nr:LysR family transcriptional regulator [Oceanicoccus sp. KOV_DT_Chl]
MTTTIDTHLLTKLGTLRQLQIFMSVAQCGSIGRAAEQLHLTQPSVSMQVRKLSEAIGLPLYEVIGRKLNLTAVGHEVLAAGEEIFDAVNRLNHRISDIKGLDSGILKIAVVSTAKYFLYHVLGPFCERYPGVDVEFTVGNRSEIIERMHKNLDDLYIIGNPPDEFELIEYPFLPNPVVVIASNKHPLAEAATLDWSDLAEQRFILRELGSDTRLSIEQHLAKYQLSMPKAMTIKSNEAIKYAVIANMGISILSAYILYDSKDLIQLQVTNFPIMSQWQMVHLRDKRLSVVAERFLRFFLEQGNKLLPCKGLKKIFDLPQTATGNCSWANQDFVDYTLNAFTISRNEAPN